MSKIPPDKYELLLPTNQGEDFTVIAQIPDLEKHIGGLFSPPMGSQTVKIKSRKDGVPDGVAEDARVQAVYCYRKKAVSFTVRGKNNYIGFLKGQEPVAKFTRESKFKPNSDARPDRLNTVEDICQAVDQVIGKGLDVPHGFLIVSGGTNSMKSMLARGLIHLYLARLIKKWVEQPETKMRGQPRVPARRPHLVTCEDDIEKELYPLGKKRTFIEKVYQDDKRITFMKKLWYTAPNLPDYTPRLLGADVGSMAQAVEDALRMTPSVFYGGEIRRKDDWRELWRLAQSHLVVLTTHAASLVNTFAVLQNHLDLRTPSQRSELANATAGVIHMRGTQFEDNKKSCVIPACWVRTPMSVAAFTAEGLASIVPKRAELADAGGSTYCLGRLAFASHLVSKVHAGGLALAGATAKDFLRLMAAWDIRGE